MKANDVIRLLRLEPHALEGGFFRETYRSTRQLEPAALGGLHDSPRSLNTAIYYLLTATSVSTLHRLPGDEIFHFYLGDPVRMLMLNKEGESRFVTLGQKIEQGQLLQHIVPGGCWQGARLVDGGSFALLGTTMAPGFDFGDFELGKLEELSSRYPDSREEIFRLTRQSADD